MLPPEPLQPGPTRDFRGWLNRLREWYVSLKVRFDPAHFDAQATANGTSVRLRLPEEFVVELTAGPPAGAGPVYGWRRVDREATAAGGWREAPANAAGTPTADPAVEINGNLAVPLTTGGHPTRVPAWRSPEDNALLFQADACA